MAPPIRHTWRVGSYFIPEAVALSINVGNQSAVYLLSTLVDYNSYQRKHLPPLTLFPNSVSLEPLFLDTIAHSPPDWIYLGKVPTESLPDWFDSQASYSSP
jgi:hypothetical protein